MQINAERFFEEGNGIKSNKYRTRTLLEKD